MTVGNESDDEDAIPIVASADRLADITEHTEMGVIAWIGWHGTII